MISGYYRHPTIAGNTIVFVSEDDLWSVDAGGGSARRLTANPGSVIFPRLSPDGSQVAYTSKDEGQTDIFVMDTTGGSARRVTFWGATSHCVGWSKDGKSLIVATDWQQPFAGAMHLHTVSLDGSPSSAWNVGPARAMSQGGRGVVLGRNSLDPARWKRYRGGRAGTLWVDAKGDGDYAPLVKLDGNLADPMWIGRRIYFISDHEGHGNIYSVTPTGRNIQRHTHHEDFYARFASTDGQRIVYHSGADLWVFDPELGETRRITVTVPSARPQLNRRFVPASKGLESVDLHPEGHSLAIVSRGTAITMPAFGGAPVRHGEDSSIRYRLTTWMADGKRVISVTDDGGEERLVVSAADGSTDVEYHAGDFGRARSIMVAPTGADRVLISNHRHELILFNLETGTSRVLYRSRHQWLHGTAWSSDGKWVAFAASITENLSAVFVANVRSGRVHQVTDGAHQDGYPSFDPGGKFLYFLSSRTYDPVPDSLMHDYGFPVTTKPHLIVLDDQTLSPTNEDMVEVRAPGAPPATGNGKGDAKKDDGPPETKITFANIERRIVALPVRHGRYRQVVGAGGRALFTSVPMSGTIGQSPSPVPEGKLESYDLAANKVETVSEGVSAITVSPDGKVLGILSGDKLRVVPVAWKGGEKNGPEKPGRESGLVDLDRVRLEIVPADEWRQMAKEAWRLQREYFWRPDMASVDWAGVLNRYLPLVDRVGSRSEFSDFLWEMQGELGTSHAYEMGGDYRPEPTYRQGTLGVDIDVTARGVTSVTRILGGDPWDPAATSPLGGSGLNIAQGDRIVSVDGHVIDRRHSVQAALADRANKPVVVEVRRGTRKSHRVAVTALASETVLRYRTWVNANRDYVLEKTDGRGGYIHIPDMGVGGFAEFHRNFLQAVDKDGIVVDVRYNRGGNVSQLLLQKLLRRRLGWRVTRWNEPAGFPYGSPAGPMVALTNESAGSDGDIFSHTFKIHRLGPLIGTRTWGGVTGIWPQQALVDGTMTTQPEYGSWFEDVGYGVENYGTDPDIEVHIRPQDYAAGTDPQMDRGIEELLKIMAAAGPPTPKFAKHPSMKAPKLPR